MYPLKNVAFTVLIPYICNSVMLPNLQEEISG